MNVPPISQSRWFSVAEFTCKDGTPYPEEWILDGRWYALASQLDIIRDEWGSPIVVTCGYRTQAYNKKLRDADIAKRGWSGVALASQHTEGRAADIRPRSGTIDLHKMIKRLSLEGKIPAIHGLGYYGEAFVHVDIRDTDHLHEWDGTKPGKWSR